VPARHPGGSRNHGIVAVAPAVSNDFLWISCRPWNSQIKWVNVSVQEEIVLSGPSVGSDRAVVVLPIHVCDCSRQQGIEIAIRGGVCSEAVRGKHVSVLGEHSEKEEVFTPSRSTRVLAQKLGRNLKLARAPQVKEACNFAGKHERAAHFNRRRLKPNLARNPCASIRNIPRRLCSPLPH